MAFNQASATVAVAPAPTASDAPDVGESVTTAMIATGTSRKPLPSSTLNGSPVIPKYRWSYDRINVVAAPVQERQRKAALPGEHHGVALHHLEQRGEDRLGERRRAGEPAARRVRDRRCRRLRSPEVDDLGREERCASVLERDAPDERCGRLLAELDEREPRVGQLRRVEEGEARRAHGSVAECGGRRRPDSLLGDEECRVSLERLADRRGARPGARGGRRRRSPPWRDRAFGGRTQARSRSSEGTPRPSSRSWIVSASRCRRAGTPPPPGSRERRPHV